MQLGLQDILTKLHHSHSSIDDILRQHREPHHRAPLLAGLFRTVLPDAPLHACVLLADSRVFSCVVDEDGNHRPEWAAQLQEELNRPRGPGGRDPVTLDSQEVAVEDILVREQTRGLLGLGLPAAGNGAVRIAVRSLLALCSRQLALYLQLEEEERARRTCEHDRDGLTWLANLGELASPVSHEINNFLNATLLHVAVLGMQAPENLSHDLADIRRQGNHMAGVVKRLQQYRRRHQPLPQPVDLNRTVREVIDDLVRKPFESAAGLPVHLSLASATEDAATPADTPTIAVTLDLEPQLPPILALPSDLKRLCSFLITNAAGAVSTAGGGAVAVRTRAGDKAVVLRVSDTGPALSADRLAGFFEPGSGGREGTDSLEVAACRSLVRRFQGAIQVQSESGAGVGVVVELPADPHT